MLPTYIGGPCILDIAGEEDLSWSNGLIWEAVSGKELPIYDYPFGSM